MGSGARLAVAGLRMGSVRLMVAGALASALGGCFFTDPVNTAPTVSIRTVGDGAVLVHEEILLRAEGVDVDGEPLVYLWRALSCPESGACDEIESGNQVMFSPWVPDHDLVRIELTVVDGHGAQATASLDLPTQNREPIADLVVTGPKNSDGGHTIGRELIVSGEITDADGDTTTGAFEVFAPPGTGPYTWEQDPADPLKYRLIPSSTGNWEIVLTPEDGYGLTNVNAATYTFRVDEDQPPCIGATTPAADAGRIIVERTAPPRRFAVESVLDDVDPWPIAPTASEELGGARFRWSVGASGALAVADGLTLPEYWFDASGRDPGEVVQIRVEVSDRVVRPMPCDDATPVCPVEGCQRRLSWEVEVR